MFGSAKWDSDFYVLTNIGVLVFKDDNFLNPLTLYPLAMIKIEQMLGKKIGGKEHIFKLFVGGDQEHILAATDKVQYDKWIKALKTLIDKAKNESNSF